MCGPSSRSCTGPSSARSCPITATEAAASVLPRTPYRGIESFRYSDQAIFFARTLETRQLLRLVVVYRGVLLYGESGSGKSSLINAGLLPAADEEGFRVDRLRVQPRVGEELVVERIPLTDERGSFLESTFASDAEDASQIVLPAAELRARLAALGEEARAHRPLLVFDQFEELVTLFEEAPEGHALEQALACQRRVVDALVEVLHDASLPVKLLFGFREDYLAKVRKLLDRCPELIGQSLRLTPPGIEALPRIIRGPFEEHPGAFDRELSPELAPRLTDAIQRRTGAAPVSLTEVQIVCLRLWESSDPEALLEEKGIQGLLEDYLEESLKRFPDELHYPAIALLSQMVTSSGARNVVSADDLVERVRSEEPDIPEERLERTLEALEKETKLVRRERRRDLDLFEISSEFLVPWIGRQREERLKARERAELERKLEQERQRQRARLIQRLGLVILGLFLVAAGMAALAFVLYGDASTQRDESRSRERAQQAFVLLDSQDDPRFRVDPDESVRTAFRAYQFSKTIEAEEALRAALVESRHRAVLAGHGGSVRGVQFSPDGRLVVTAGQDGTARLWDAAGGRQVGRPLLMPRVNGLRIPVNGASFSPDGRLVVTAGADGTARIWNVATRREAGRLAKNKAGINTASFSPDGTLVVTASDDGTVRIWRWATGDQPAELRGVGGRVFGASFSPDGKLVVSSTDDIARVWSWSSGKITMLRGHTGPVLKAVFSGDEKLVVTASADGTARLWNAASGSQVGPPLLMPKVEGLPDAPRAPASSAAFSPDGRYVVTTALATSRQLQVWEVLDKRGKVGRKLVMTLRGPNTACNDAAFSPHGTLIASACDGGDARLWDPGVGKTARPAIDVRTLLSGAAFSPDGRLVVTAGRDGAARLWNVTRRREVGRPLALAGTVDTSASFSPDGKRIVTASTNGTAVIWESATGRRLLVLRGHVRPVLSAAFSPDGTLVVTAGEDGTARIWDVATGQQVGEPLELPTAVRSASFSPDGKLVLTAGDDGAARLWDVASRRPLEPLGSSATGPATTAAFSPDGSLVAVAKHDGTATIWSIAGPQAPKVVALLRGHTWILTGVSFSRDGKFVVTSSRDGTARVWEAHSGRRLNLLRADPGGVVSASFSPRDPNVVLTADGDGTLRLFRCDACLPIDALIRLGNWTRSELTGESPR